MITQSQIKHIRSLHQKKFRDEHKQFIAEGPKIVEELLRSGVPVVCIYGRKEWIEQNPELISGKNIDVIEVNEKELERISNLNTPNMVLAVLETPAAYEIPENDLNGVCLVLDGISDPGNFGTIIRTADWFGIRTIVCSENCVELYNPKVIQSTMGSFARVKIVYTDLEQFLQSVKGKKAVYGTFTEGTELAKVEKRKDAVIIIGNESKGISASIHEFIDIKVSIPSRAGSDNLRAESLNASVATAVVCYEFTK